MVIIFFSLIFGNLKNGLWLIIIKDNFFNKELLANLESDTGNSTTQSSYRREKVKTILNFRNKDRLTCMA